MGRYFGTDGIRGAADMFTAEFLERIVRGLEVRDKRVLIGGDTRESTKHILENLERSLSNNGAREIGNVGVFPTPGINFVMHSLVYDYAIDVTASHNPYTDNGIKIFEYADAGGERAAVVDGGSLAHENGLEQYRRLFCPGSVLHWPLKKQHGKSHEKTSFRFDRGFGDSPS